MKSFKIKIWVSIIITGAASLLIFLRLLYVSWPGSLVLPKWSANPSPKLRGAVMDRNGAFLALTVSSSSIFLRPILFRNKKETLKKLSKATGISVKRIKKRLKSGTKNFVWLMRQVSKEIGRKVKKLKLSGVEVTSEPRRIYPFGHLASHLIGFSGIDHTGLTGLEKGYDNLLIRRNNNSGKNIVLTIDRFIQYLTELELEKALKQTRAKRAMCLIYHPSTGEIIAMASKPDFDLNHFTSYKTASFINHNISIPYEPGSTFKIFTAAYILKKRLFSLKKKFYCTGKIKIYDHTVHDIEGHGMVNLSQIIKHSCNVGIVMLSRRITKTGFYNFLSSLDFGKRTRTGLPGEARGILRLPSRWSGLSKSIIPLGQEISVTPLQLVKAAGTFATRGILLKPTVIKAITDSDGKTISSSSPRPIRRVFSNYISKKVSLFMKDVVSQNGTGHMAMINGIPIEGKTGTAEIPRPDGKGYYKDKYNSSFLGFFPFKNTKFIALVIIQEPKGEHLGGKIAAPVFRRIVLRTLDYLKKSGLK